MKDVLVRRYSTKVFNPDKTIPAVELAQIKALLQLSPSSVNLQPWHFFIVSSPEGKASVEKAANAFYPPNAKKISSASHVVVFCARTDIDDDFLEAVLAAEEQAGRFADEEMKAIQDQGRRFFIGTHRDEYQDLPDWLEKQVYLNMGGLLLGAASLDIDAIAMEGLDFVCLDKELGLSEQGLHALAVVALGYRDADDPNQPDHNPKSRLPQEQIITEI